MEGGINRLWPIKKIRRGYHSFKNKPGQELPNPDLA
jgi:hypothetical protein